MEWLGRAKIGYTHHSSPLTLKTKAGGETDLRKLVETSTPPCRLNPFIFNGHLQTMWTVNDLDGPPVYYRRKVFQAEQEAYIGSYAVDFAVAPHSAHDDLDNLPPRTAYYSKEQFDNIASEDTRPMVFILHGLSGGSYEVYLRHCSTSFGAEYFPRSGRISKRQKLTQNFEKLSRSKTTNSRTGYVVSSTHEDAQSPK